MDANDMGLGGAMFEQDAIPTRKLTTGQSIISASALLQSTAQTARKSIMLQALPRIPQSESKHAQIDGLVTMVETSVQVSADLIVLLNFESVWQNGDVIRSSTSSLSHEVLQFQFWLLKNCKSLRSNGDGRYFYSKNPDDLVAFFPSWEWNKGADFETGALLIEIEKLKPFIKASPVDEIEWSKAWFQMNKINASLCSWDVATSFDNKFQHYYKTQKENGILT